MTVLDASAILAWLQGETGAEIVDHALSTTQCKCSAANWSEVAQKVRQREASWPASEALLKSYDIIIEPTNEQDAIWAANKWANGTSLSLADRLCMATGARLDEPILTADGEWSDAALTFEMIRG